MRLLDDVRGEVLRARTKFPSNEHLLLALQEEVGELTQACLNEFHGEAAAKGTDVYKELVQVICMCVRLYEEGDPTIGLASPAGAPVHLFEREPGQWYWQTTVGGPNGPFANSARAMVDARACGYDGRLFIDEIKVITGDPA